MLGPYTVIKLLSIQLFNYLIVFVYVLLCNCTKNHQPIFLKQILKRTNH